MEGEGGEIRPGEDWRLSGDIVWLGLKLGGSGLGEGDHGDPRVGQGEAG